MKKLSFSIAVGGIFLLVLFMEFSFTTLSAKSAFSDISNNSLFESLPDNSQIFIKGKVISEKSVGDTNSILYLDNGFEVVCSCENSYVNKSVEIEGIFDVFNERKKILVLRIFSQP